MSSTTAIRARSGDSTSCGCMCADCGLLAACPAFCSCGLSQGLLVAELYDELVVGSCTELGHEGDGKPASRGVLGVEANSAGSDSCLSRACWDTCIGMSAQQPTRFQS